MKPVFREEMDFLGIDSKLEGYLWVDSRCYYGFDKEFNKIKFGRNLEKLPKNVNNLSNHDDVCKNYYEKFTKEKVKIERYKFKEYIDNNEFDEIIISISGGKDSTVTYNMVKDLCNGLKTQTLFGNTSNETHYTYQYIKRNYPNSLWCNPKKGFNTWCYEERYIPTRFGRACCSIFKEGNISEYLNKKEDLKLLHICGIRRDESKARSEYEQIRKGKWATPKQKENWTMYLPIIDFNDMDVWSYIIINNLDFNQLYRFGYNRVGCTNCPFRSDYELKLNEHFLPTYDKHWKRLLKDIFIKDGQAVSRNCTLEEYLGGAWKAGVVREEPTDEVIEEFAKYKGIDIEQAKKYFTSNKCSCGKRLTKDVIALNMKLLGRNTNGRMCLKCLAEFVGTDVKTLKKQIEEFKQEGCQLF